MALFKAKKKVVSYETEASLPRYRVDQNGFIMFTDASLGGAAILEITPRVATEAFTHEDPYDKSDLSLVDYEARTGFGFSDARSSILPAWVAFINSLQARDVSDEPTHIQILAKKSTPPVNRHTGERLWDTELMYAVHSTRKQSNELARKYRRGSQKRNLIEKRSEDYLRLLYQLDGETVSEYDKHINNRLPVELRHIQAYTTRFYIIISYTPSSEGWWMDGRDSDYYIADSTSPTALFKDDKIVDKAVDVILKRRNKNTVDEEGDFFHLESDRIAQVLATRVNKILRFAREWDSDYWTHKDDPEYDKDMLPFGLRRVSGLEAAALVCFFPDIHTPYWDRIWGLRSNEDDVLYGIDVDSAIYTRDYDSIASKQLSRSITDADVHIAMPDDARQAYLERFKHKGYADVANVSSDYEEQLWSPEREQEQRAKSEYRDERFNEIADLWGEVDENLIIDDEDKTDAQRRQEYLDKFKNRGGTSIKQLFAEPGTEEQNKRLSGPPELLPGEELNIWED